MKNVLLLFLMIFLVSCEQDDEVILDENILSEYIELNRDLEQTDLIACAGGKDEGLSGNNTLAPTSIFFYPIEGASDFRYYETESISEGIDYSSYIRKELPSEPVFNGYLYKFNNEPFAGERMGIVTYKTPGKLHVCNPIRLKTNVKPTEVNADLVTIFENGVSPSFIWEDGAIPENVIYFQVISDLAGNLISGTYTFDKNFTFYNLDNVVLNITDESSSPVLEANKEYKFTMMGVSEDNWVNLLIETTFQTN